MEGNPLPIFMATGVSFLLNKQIHRHTLVDRVPNYRVLVALSSSVVPEFSRYLVPRPKILCLTFCSFSFFSSSLLDWSRLLSFVKTSCAFDLSGEFWCLVDYCEGHLWCQIKESEGARRAIKLQRCKWDDHKCFVDSSKRNSITLWYFCTHSSGQSYIPHSARDLVRRGCVFGHDGRSVGCCCWLENGVRRKQYRPRRPEQPQGL